MFRLLMNLLTDKCVEDMKKIRSLIEDERNVKCEDANFITLIVTFILTWEYEKMRYYCYTTPLPPSYISIYKIYEYIRNKSSNLPSSRHRTYIDPIYIVRPYIYILPLVVYSRYTLYYHIYYILYIYYTVATAVLLLLVLSRLH